MERLIMNNEDKLKSDHLFIGIVLVCWTAILLFNKLFNQLVPYSSPIHNYVQPFFLVFWYGGLILISIRIRIMILKIILIVSLSLLLIWDLTSWAYYNFKPAEDFIYFDF